MIHPASNLPYVYLHYFITGDMQVEVTRQFKSFWPMSVLILVREVDVTEHFLLIQNVLATNLVGHMYAIDCANVAVYTL
jgi:hypothetical protein